ncbi:SF1B family DNA helicase RecD2 [Thomasclavelia ramosa]|uniref:SF1B family DNA helicase RecD2 n=1 Tax=Thomasclavelia ramosa TaxID=1547 RepID=UPI00344EC1DC
MKLSLQNSHTLEKIRGYVTYVFYPKSKLMKDTVQFVGFSIKSGKKNISCWGTMSNISQGDYFELEGFYQKDGSFKFKSALRVDDDELGATSMLSFLFGPKTAAMLINYFNSPIRCINLFKNNQTDFELNALNIKGIGPKKLEKAYTKYENNIAVDVLYARFSKYGLTLNQALKIFSTFGTDCLKRIESNPYILTSIDIPWKCVDFIALNYYKISCIDDNRLFAGIMSSLKSIRNRGHVYINLDSSDYNLLNLATQKLEVDISYIKEAIFKLQKEEKIVITNYNNYKIVYMRKMYDAEQNVSKLCAKLVSNSKLKKRDKDRIHHYIDNYEENHFKLADKQKEAIESALSNTFSIISGPPGSGKTTIIDVICSYFKYYNKNIRINLCAPTAKAAKRMFDSTGIQASTIHRLLEFNPADGEGGFKYNEYNPLKTDILVVDEFSMVDLLMTENLLKAIPETITALIFVGDINQLPSVDAGRVLEDMLQSKIPSTLLNKIYRQQEDSTLLQKALDFSKEKSIELADTKDFFFYSEKNELAIQEGVVNLFISEVEKYGIENVALLIPQNEGTFGVNTLNCLIQEKLNPKLFDTTPELRSGRRKFRIGDRVIHTVNEDNHNVFNGMVGTITNIEIGDKDFDTEDTIIVDYGEDELSEYHRDRFDNIKLAYAMTIHKSQGSEYKSVIMILHMANRFMLTKKLVYTGMTRAKSYLHLVGDEYAVNYAMKRNIPPRNSRLDILLKNNLE